MALQTRTGSGTARRTTTRATTRTRGQDAVTLLTADHRQMKKLFNAFKRIRKQRASRSTRAEKADLVQQICLELTVHADIEEELFYPAVRRAIKNDELMDEAEVEHASLKELVNQLSSMNPGDALYDAKVTVLGEYMDSHVKEEEKRMFTLANKSRLNMATLGGELRERKDELLAQLTPRSKKH